MPLRDWSTSFNEKEEHMELYNVFKAYLDGDDNPAEWYMFTTSCNVNEVRDYCRNKNRELKYRRRVYCNEYFYFKKVEILTSL